MNTDALTSDTDFAFELILRDGCMGLKGANIGAANKPIALAENVRKGRQ